MVVTGATGGIGKELRKQLNARAYDPRKDKDLQCSVLVNCFGINIDGVAHKAASFGNFMDVVGVNLVDTFEVIQRALPYMRMQNYGRIINLTSFVAYKGIPGTSAYAASKGGVDSMIKAIAVENAKHNVTINNLCLGYFDAGMTHRIPNYKKLKEQIPMGEFGKVEEIVKAVYFLSQSEYITGSVIHINGGLW